MPKELYADILVEVPGVRTEKTYQYQVPHHLRSMISKGQRVSIPFGGRMVNGYVVGLTDTRAADNLKEIAGLTDSKILFTPEQLDLARWLAGYYFCDTVKALQTIIAPVLNQTASRRLARYYYNTDNNFNDFCAGAGKRAPKSVAVLEAAIHNPGLSRSGLAGAAGASESVVDRLAAKNMLLIDYLTVMRDPYPEFKKTRLNPFKLTTAQEKAVQMISGNLLAGKPNVYLLHGVTGSGKTEVYLRCIEQALQSGRQAITLVPEISLTPQMVRLFRERFGTGVAVLHSRMSDGERYDEWTRIEQGSAPVVLGARSAVLAPLRDPGLIIIDEEHEWSYKQEETPRYHARAVALYRAKKKNGVLLLGSATPSLESYGRALPGGVYKLINLENRIEGRAMPKVHIVDMREEIRVGNGGIFSRVLLHQIEENIKQNKLTIIFLNRRGLNTLVVCRECGFVVKCPRCDVSLTYHVDGKLRCHYCNFTVRAPKLCTECGGRQVGYFGTGTQRVEHELQLKLPGARILRMDSDTTTRKGSHQRILDAFTAGEADILVGTQMIAKGLDIAGVTLVGVINADITLHMPDFRAAERTFQLLAQVAGRTGRGDIPGQVLVQTYTPEHYAIKTAAMHDYHSFFRHELEMRRVMGYPPFAKMIRFLFQGEKEQSVREAAEKWRQQLEGFTAACKEDKIFIAGPAPAPLARLKNNFRWHVIIWSSDYGALRQVMDELRRSTGFASVGKGLRLTVDVDPMSLS